MTKGRHPEDTPDHPNVVTLVKLPRVWEQTLFDVFVEERQLEEARRIAAEYIQ